MPSNLDLSAFQSPYDSASGVQVDAFGNVEGATSYQYNPSYTSQFDLSGQTQGSAANSIGQAIQSAPTMGSDFMQGMKLGYMGEQMTVAPFLSYRKAKQQKNILSYQAELLEMQAQSYRTAAEDVMRAGHQQSAQVSYAVGQAKGTTRATMAANGVRVGGSGSSAEVLASFDIVKEMQTNQIIANAVAQSWGYRRQAVNYDNQALAVRSAQKQISPWAAAITTFVSSNIQAFNSVGDMFNTGNGGGFSASTWKNFGSFWK